MFLVDGVLDVVRIFLMNFKEFVVLGVISKLNGLLELGGKDLLAHLFLFSAF